MEKNAFKIGQVSITTKMIISLVGAFFILGIGIGATAVLPGHPSLPILVCTAISLIVIAKVFYK